MELCIILTGKTSGVYPERGRGIRYLPDRHLTGIGAA